MLDLPRGVTVQRGGGHPESLELVLGEMRLRRRTGYVRVADEGDAGRAAEALVLIVDGEATAAWAEEEETSWGEQALGAALELAARSSARFEAHLDVDVAEHAARLGRGSLPRSGESARASIRSDRVARLPRVRPGARLIRQQDAVAQGELSVLRPAGHSGPPVPPPLSREMARAGADERTPAAPRREVKKGGPPRPPHTPTPPLEPALALLIDALEPDLGLELARVLAVLEHPLLVLSRRPPARLVEDHDLPREDSRWLTDRSVPDGQAIAPSLEIVSRALEDFLRASVRGVAVLDGLEYLVSGHGFARTLDMVRDVVDLVRADGHLLVLPVDLRAVDPRERHLLHRELDPVDADVVRAWLARGLSKEPFTEEIRGRRAAPGAAQARRDVIDPPSHEEVELAPPPIPAPAPVVTPSSPPRPAEPEPRTSISFEALRAAPRAVDRASRRDEPRAEWGPDGSVAPAVIPAPDDAVPAAVVSRTPSSARPVVNVAPEPTHPMAPPPTPAAPPAPAPAPAPEPFDPDTEIEAELAALKEAPPPEHSTVAAGPGRRVQTVDPRSQPASVRRAALREERSGRPGGAPAPMDHVEHWETRVHVGKRSLENPIHPNVSPATARRPVHDLPREMPIAQSGPQRPSAVMKGRRRKRTPRPPPHVLKDGLAAAASRGRDVPRLEDIPLSGEGRSAFRLSHEGGPALLEETRFATGAGLAAPVELADEASGRRPARTLCADTAHAPTGGERRASRAGRSARTVDTTPETTSEATESAPSQAASSAVEPAAEPPTRMDEDGTMGPASEAAPAETERTEVAAEESAGTEPDELMSTKEAETPADRVPEDEVAPAETERTEDAAEESAGTEPDEPTSTEEAETPADRAPASEAAPAETERTEVAAEESAGTEPDEPTSTEEAETPADRAPEDEVAATPPEDHEPVDPLAAGPRPGELADAVSEPPASTPDGEADSPENDEVTMTMADEDAVPPPEAEDASDAEDEGGGLSSLMRQWTQKSQLPAPGIDEDLLDADRPIPPTLAGPVHVAPFELPSDDATSSIRLDALRRLGHPTRHLVEQLRADEEAGLAALSETEAQAIVASRLNARLVERLEAGLVDETEAFVFRVDLRNLQRLDAIAERLGVADPEDEA